MRLQKIEENVYWAALNIELRNALQGIDKKDCTGAWEKLDKDNKEGIKKLLECSADEKLLTITKEITKYLENFKDDKGENLDILKMGIFFQLYTEAYNKKNKL